MSFGDGIYKSTDGGQTWKHMGLRNSEHIGKILVDPHNSDRGLCRRAGTALGGRRRPRLVQDDRRRQNLEAQSSRSARIPASSDIVFDPRNANVIYAAAYQRRRNVGVLVGGGPEGAIYKTEDGGANWKKLTTGIPAVDLGRIALAVSPQNPNVVYAHITASGKEGGFFRSPDCGATWVRQSDYQVVDPQYYGEIYADPHKFDRVYAMDVAIHVTDDGGKSMQRVPWAIHTDNHALAFDPTDAEPPAWWATTAVFTKRTTAAARGAASIICRACRPIAWQSIMRSRFTTSMAVHQDNGSQGGPSRTLNRAGIRTSDWITVGGGDGMQARVDPEDPNIVYSSAQNGAVSRLDERTGISVSIRPNIGQDQPRVRWNWDTPLVISPHSASRLYLAGSRLFRSDDRGQNWKPISPDLTRQIDRETIPVMGRVWGSQCSHEEFLYY